MQIYNVQYANMKSSMNFNNSNPPMYVEQLVQYCSIFSNNNL